MIKKIIKFLLVTFLLFLVVLFTINFYVLSFGDKNYFESVKDLPKSEYGIVFGASVNKDGSPSLVLQDRLDVAIKAYNSQKIKKIIVSGFASKDGYNEPIGMQKYLIKNGISKENIIKDEKGIDTYNSLIQAKILIGKKSIILFTQDFQLKRAIYISEKSGLNFYGMETNLREYKKNNYFRELGARVKAFLELDIFIKILLFF